MNKFLKKLISVCYWLAAIYFIIVALLSLLVLLFLHEASSGLDNINIFVFALLCVVSSVTLISGNRIGFLLALVTSVAGCFALVTDGNVYGALTAFQIHSFSLPLEFLGDAVYLRIDSVFLAFVAFYIAASLLQVSNSQYNNQIQPTPKIGAAD